MRKSRENGLFLDIPDEQWNDWHWQVANRVETLDELKKYIKLTPEEEEGIAATLGKLRMATSCSPAAQDWNRLAVSARGKQLSCILRR